MDWSTVEIGPLTNDSWILVSSRQITIGQSPRIVKSSWSVVRIRCGASKNTAVWRASRSFLNHKILSFDLFGGNPRNEKASVDTPATARAAITALGPGI